MGRGPPGRPRRAAADRLAELAGRVIDAADGSGLPLFCGWRAERPPTAAPPR
ncbi:hypothetical protein [Actinomadura sp. CNU-125]|uniref:hypothetical protein n=1 Tax=Actinomadura sp. CNU-125 TaxID=1904961 RepID=UPI001300D476|nr:hypothetical protein [Actinomadura sp. CNU-125]